MWWVAGWLRKAENKAKAQLGLTELGKKWVQGTLETQRSTIIGSRTCLGPSMDPAMALQYTCHGPLYIGYIFAFYATKMVSWDSGDTKVPPHWVLVYCRAMAGSSEGTRWVLDPMRGDLFVPRIP